MPELHVVAGPNGAGKTTCFKLLVPEGIDYINADLIAKTIKEKAGGLNTQNLANQEAASLFWNKVSWQKFPQRDAITPDNPENLKISVFKAFQHRVDWFQ